MHFLVAGGSGSESAETIRETAVRTVCPWNPGLNPVQKLCRCERCRGFPVANVSQFQKGGRSDLSLKPDQALAIALTRAVSLETFRLAAFFGTTPFWAVRASSGSAVFIAASAAD